MILPDGFVNKDPYRDPNRDLNPEELDKWFDEFMKVYPRTVRDDGRARAKAVYHKYIRTLWDLRKMIYEYHRWRLHWKALGWPRAAIPKPHTWLEMQTWLE